MKKTKKYHGVVVPMVTPLTSSGELDKEAVIRICTNFVKHDVSPLLMGTTGEGASVPIRMGCELIQTAKEICRDRVTVYTGIPGNCVKEQTEAAEMFRQAGADVVAATLPCYYTLTPAQMENYYRSLAHQLKLPLMLYNITITTHMSIPLDVVERLSHEENIVGLKDSENNIPRLEEALELFSERDDFSYFCGCAANSAIALKRGADGIVPSVGNYWPEAYRRLYEAGISGKDDEAANWQLLTVEAGKVNTECLTLGESLAGLKVIMKMRGLCEEYMLPPLSMLSAEKADEIRRNFSSLPFFDRMVDDQS